MREHKAVIKSKGKTSAVCNNNISIAEAPVMSKENLDSEDYKSDICYQETGLNGRLGEYEKF